MEHAHPSPLPSLYGNENSQQRSYRPRPFYLQPTTPSPLGSSRNQDEPLSLQRRRLQLRNSGFRAPQLAGRRISPQFPGWTATSGEKDTERSKENTSPASQRRKTYGESPPPNTVSILQEITNSNRRRHSPRPSIGTLFDNSQAHLSADTPSMSWYRDITPRSSPFDIDSSYNSHSTMKPAVIHEDDENTPPPMSSPLAKQIKGRKKRSLNLRKTSFEASQYIEHLETQLTLAQTQAEILSSPSGSRRKPDRNRALNIENKDLKLELADWEKRFEIRLKDAIQGHTENEHNFRNQLRTLEQELQARECVIRDLEQQNNRTGWDQKTVEALAETNCSLEATNRSLEKRIDVLTELLALSPIKSQHGFELSSPVREGLRKTPRPKSMMPRIPSSPGGAILYRPMSAAPSPATTPMSLPTASSPMGDYGFSPLQESPRSLEAKRFQEDGRSLDSGLGGSCSTQSAAVPASQRSSMISTSSSGPAAWGLPLPGPLEERSGQPGRSRKMRRFASGSNSLKPLLLPSATNSMSIPTSVQLLPALPAQTSGLREVSGESMDPTVSFLSQPTFETLPQPQRSSTWAADDALKALEGGAVHFDSFDEILAKHEAMMSSNEHDEIPVQLLEQKFEEPFSPSQLDGVIFEEDVTTFLGHDFPIAQQNTATMAVEPLVKEEYNSDQDNIMPSLEAFDIPSLPPLEPDFDLVMDGMAEWHFDPDPKPLPLRLPPNPRKRRKSNTPPDQDDTPKPLKVKSSNHTFRPQPKSIPLAALAAPSSAFGLIRKYTQYFRELRRNPTALARRVIANAWHSNWGRLGSLSWWVLGLFFGSGSTSKEKEYTSDTAAHTDDDFNWHSYSTEASKARKFEMQNGPGPALEEFEQGRSTAYRYKQQSRPRLRSKSSKVTFENERDIDDSRRTKKCKNCDSEQQTLGKKIKLWARFSFALVLAVGGAIKDGPAAMMADCTEGPHHGPGRRDGEQYFASASTTPGSEGSSTLDAGQFAFNCESFEDHTPFDGGAMNCDSAAVMMDDLGMSEPSLPDYDLSPI